MRFIAVALAILAVLGSSGIAGAATGDAFDDTQVSVGSNDTGYTLEINAWDAGGGVALAPDPLRDCVFISGLSGLEVTEYAGGRGIELGVIDPDMADSDLVTWVFMSCDARVFGGFTWAVWEEGDPPPAPVINALAASARASIVIPPLTPESAPDGLDTPFLTQLPVWLWVPADSWVPLTGSASLPALGLTITATATPSTTEWVTGAEEGGTLICEAGTPWEPGLDDDLSDCAAIYGTTTPPGTTIDLTVTTTYGIAFTCTPGLCNPAAINLPGFAVTVARPVTITEARGVISG